MDLDVIIVGGGLVGGGLALALGQAGLRIAIVEAQVQRFETEGWDRRIYAISPASAAFLDRCGAWTGLDAARMERVEEMRVFGDDAKSELSFSAYESGLRELAFIVENRALQQAVWERLKQQPQIEIIAPAQCTSLTIASDAVELELGNGRILRAQLLVGADGGDSWVRAQAGIEATVHAYGQRAVVANFATERQHRGTAFQWFQPGAVLALLPLPGKLVSMVWSLPDAGAQRALSLTHEELASEVGAASGHVLGDLETVTAPSAFPLQLQRVSRLIAPRIALVGDAAHNVHPLAGQGMNLGLRDARELASVLAQRGPQNDSGDYYLLRRYERARQEDIMSMRFTTDALQKLFKGDNPLLARLRNFGLRATQRQRQLKNLLISHAVG